MDREKWAKLITVLVVVAGAVGASDMFPDHVSRWALWGASVVTAIGGALGFNTGRRRTYPIPDDLPRYQR